MQAASGEAAAPAVMVKGKRTTLQLLLLLLVNKSYLYSAFLCYH